MLFEEVGEGNGEENVNGHQEAAKNTHFPWNCEKKSYCFSDIFSGFLGFDPEYCW